MASGEGAVGDALGNSGSIPDGQRYASTEPESSMRR
jgi:hypothetical protein